jgi:hypothetical protein
MVKTISPEMSMIGWDLITYAKKRKKTLITLVGVGVGFLITDSELIALIAGGVIEGILAIAEFYMNKIKL